jgi:hypothetical protein
MGVGEAAQAQSGRMKYLDKNGNVIDLLQGKNIGHSSHQFKSFQRPNNRRANNNL